MGLHWWGAHGAGGALQGAQLVLAFDAQTFRSAVGQHRAGRGPRPQHHVTLAVGQELGPHDGPHNRPLVLQLEQAFARELLDGAAPRPIAAP
ncbi:hypothetical protein Q9966_016236 [Columba livia]|nr:hypothetical protein Q9966_016236 [Columba livia]